MPEEPANEMPAEERRRPRQNYFEMGLKSGDIIRFPRLPEEQAEVVDEHQLRWRGELISLTALRHRLGQRYGGSTYYGPISSGNRLIDDIYDETYGHKVISRFEPVSTPDISEGAKVYIANFGRENYEWPNCLARRTVATMNAISAHDFWSKGDRDGYVEHCLKHMTTATGNRPTRPVASRWFNLMTVISETNGDIWIHRERDQLWWSISKDEPPTILLDIDPTRSGDQRVYVCHKPCQPWSDHNRNGTRLDWKSLHPKAKEFLFTEGTLQRLADDNAAYAIALISGDDLAPWHSRTEWKAKLAAAKAAPGKIFSSREKAIARMAMIAMKTAATANGQEVLRTIKNKEVRFDHLELEKYIADLIRGQEGLCALTGIELGYDGECEDGELLCSLDRIDSDGHYEAGNLQVVCKFANRWKNAEKDDEFRRLIGLVRSSAAGLN